MNVPKDIVNAYEGFFIKSESGKYFSEQLVQMIEAAHEGAENNPELSRDFVQRAKGIREVTAHIKSVIGGTGRE